MNAAPTLGRWVGDTPTFFEKYWRARPHVFTSSGHSPFTLADLDAALATGFFRQPYLEMVADNNAVPAHRYTSTRSVARAKPAGFVDPAKVAALLDEGATLLLRRIDQWHEPTRALLADLAGELGLAVEAFYFVTPAGRTGLPLHRDDADVLVIQVAGGKSWVVHEGPADGNWCAGPIPDHEQPPAELLRTVVHPGDVLYIPRGFAHRATGQQGLSAHLSLTIREIGAADLSAQAWEAAIGDVESTLEPLPLTDDALTAAAASLLEGARQRLAGLTPEELVCRARQARVTRMPAPAPGPGLADRA